MVVDDIVREAVLTDAADRVGPIFRRKVLRELGPFSTSTDAVLDAVPQADVDARIRELGKLDLAREARAMVRPDLERLLLYHQSLPDPAARLDDILLTACSDWVNEYSGLRQHRRGPAGHLPRAGHEARAGAVEPDGRAVVAVARSAPTPSCGNRSRRRHGWRGSSACRRARCASRSGC